MPGKDLFNTVVRLAGLYMLLRALAALLSMLFMAAQIGPEGGGAVALVVVGSVLGQGLIGYFFFSYAHRIGNYAWAAEESEDSSAT